MMGLSRSASSVLARLERLIYVAIWMLTMMFGITAGVVGWAWGEAHGSDDYRFRLRTLQSEYDMLEANYDIVSKRREKLERADVARRLSPRSTRPDTTSKGG
jgi:hypothetical protein